MTGTWLIGISGGPDSMALLSLCLEAGIDCAAAHVNYHHRPQAEEEEAYVRSFCKEHHVPLHVLNTPFVYSGNFEAAARDRRYQFFVQTVKENGYRGILIAHHEDDLLETYFMQEEKNIEPAYYGLKEETMYQGVIVRRPLLSYTKKDLEQYCQSKGIRYYIDSTNSDEKYTRNRIRHTIVEPMTRVERDMVLREIRQRNAVKQERICRVKAMVSHNKTELKTYRQMSEDDRLALLRVMLENNHFSKAYLQQIDSILCSKNDFVIPYGQKQIVQNQGCFFLAETMGPYEHTYHSLEEIKDASADCYAVSEGNPGIYALTLYGDDYPITVRSFQKGDKIQMRFGTKAVHRFFIDRHIPMYQRPLWPIVVSRSGMVILVPGLGCDTDHYSDKPNISILPKDSLKPGE